MCTKSRLIHFACIGVVPLDWSRGLCWWILFVYKIYSGIKLKAFYFFLISIQSEKELTSFFQCGSRGTVLVLSCLLFVWENIIQKKGLDWGWDKNQWSHYLQVYRRASERLFFCKTLSFLCTFIMTSFFSKKSIRSRKHQKFKKNTVSKCKIWVVLGCNLMCTHIMHPSSIIF